MSTSIISFPEGTDLTQGFVAQDVSGAIIDLTDSTNLTLKVWPSPREAQAAVATLLVGGGLSELSIDSAVDGEFSATFLADLIPRGVYVYEVGVTLSTGENLMIGRGDLYVTESFLNG